MRERTDVDAVDTLHSSYIYLLVENSLGDG